MCLQQRSVTKYSSHPLVILRQSQTIGNLAYHILECPRLGRDLKPCGPSSAAAETLIDGM
jgi:hypothetical protein